MVLTPQYSGYEKRASDMNWKFGTVLQPFNFKCVCHLASTICCCCSVTKSCLTHCDPMDCSTPSFPVLHYFLEFAKTHVHWIDDAIQPCHPLSSPFPPALNLSQHQGLFQWVQWVLLIRWPKYCSFSFNISPSKEYSGLISLRINWFGLAVQGTLKSSPAPRFESISSSALSLLYKVQLSHPFMMIGKKP